jgi:hypothetical protein
VNRCCDHAETTKVKLQGNKESRGLAWPAMAAPKGSPTGTRRLPVAAALLVMLLAGCSSTRIDALWESPQVAVEASRGPVLVVGVTHDETLRRLYEDAMTAALAKQSARGIASYRVLPGPLEDASSDHLLRAAREAGAARLLSSAIVDRQLVLPADVPGPGRGWRYARWYSLYWPYTYGPAFQPDSRLVARTTISDVGSGTVVWAARSNTRNLGSIKDEMLDFADAIVHALREDGLLKVGPAS